MNTILGTAALIIRIIDGILVPLIFAVAFIVFIWGVFNYFIAGAADEEKRKKGKDFVMYGIIGFFLMISVWGIVNIFVRTFGFNSQARPSLPQFGPSSSYGGHVVPNNSGEDSCFPLLFGSGCGNNGSSPEKVPGVVE
jgi:hypothetical protein